jgi:hypothetical protein
VLELGIKAGRQTLEEQWRKIRRGWYLGGDVFHGRLLKRIKATLEQGRKTSYTGPAKREHGVFEAEQMVKRGLPALGLQEEQLAQAPKGLAAKQVLAWALRKRTTVGRRWVSERLWMGEESAVSRAVQRVREGQDAKLNRMKKRLIESLIEPGGAE